MTEFNARQTQAIAAVASIHGGPVDARWTHYTLIEPDVMGCMVSGSDVGSAIRVRMTPVVNTRWEVKAGELLDNIDSCLTSSKPVVDLSELGCRVTYVHGAYRDSEPRAAKPRPDDVGLRFDHARRMAGPVVRVSIAKLKRLVDAMERASFPEESVLVSVSEEDEAPLWLCSDTAPGVRVEAVLMQMRGVK